MTLMSHERAIKVASNLPTFDLPEPNPVLLGGKVHNVVRDCRLVCKIEGYNILTHARVLDEIGIDEDGGKFEVLIGALTIQIFVFSFTFVKTFAKTFDVFKEDNAIIRSISSVLRPSTY